MTAKQKLGTASQVIDAAGGTSAVARLFGVSIPAVCKWRREGLPAKRYVAWRAILEELDVDAPTSLWGMDP